MKSLYLFIALILSLDSLAQGVQPALERAISQLQNDPQFKHATIGLLVTNKNGDVVFGKNAESGMTPASTLKVVTSVTAYEKLGKNFRFKTQIALDGPIKNNELAGNLNIIAGGDPTLGSNRWAATKPEVFYQKVKQILVDKGIAKISGGIVVNENKFLYPPVPRGWIWEDMGNYYGAGAWGLNWLENKYAVHLVSSSEVGEPTRIAFTSPVMLAKQITNQISSAARGSGDNAFLFSAPYSEEIFATGTIPAGEKDFVIYGALPIPPKVFVVHLKSALTGTLTFGDKRSSTTAVTQVIETVYSPPLDSINFWFLKESINLFGEALVKAMAIEEGKTVSTATGIDLVRNFWAKQGIETSALKIIDGSGLSPANRITPRVLVQVLQFAKSKDWFGSFLYAMPDINGIRMKSGYIGGVRSYAGYVKSKSGEEYTFAFIINNFDGAASTVREKMYSVLNLLK